MLRIKSNNYEIFWGDSTAACLPVENPEATVRAMQVSKNIGLSPLVLLRQTHSIEGFIVKNCSGELFERVGDFVITCTPGLAIGVLTADCIPLILLGSPAGETKIVAGVVHAGWRGLFKGVIEQACQIFIEQHGVDPVGMQVAIGPSIGPCCYIVQEDFCAEINNSKNGRFGSQILEYHDTVVRADLVKGACAILENCGVLKKNIDLSSWVCTCCSTEFCSYRRGGQSAGRNLSVVRLFTSDE